MFTEHFYREAVMLAWPWAPRLHAVLRKERPSAFSGPHLLVASDYGGGQKASRYETYAFLIVDAAASPEWPPLARAVRERYLPDGRRMSFKALTDSHRRTALSPFLRAADSLTGHLVCIAVSKALTQLSTGERSLDIWARLHGVRGRWDRDEFENLVRVVQFFTLIVGAWSRPRVHVSWLTDQDRVVANDARHDDLLLLADRMGPFFIRDHLGELACFSTSVDEGDRAFEDLASIPDLAAGMLAELATRSSHAADVDETIQLLKSSELSSKTVEIASWFWRQEQTLRRVAVSIDADGRKVRVSRLVPTPDQLIRSHDD